MEAVPATRTPRERWIEQGLRALADGGPDAVRVEPLAEALGVTKGGFYWHFAGRPALLEEMLDAWEQTVIDAVIAQIETTGGDAADRLRHLFALGAAKSDLLPIELAIRDWARRDEAVAARLRRVDTRRMEYMRALFGELSADPDDVEVRCLVAFSLFVGTHFVAAAPGPTGRREVLTQALERLLEP